MKQLGLFERDETHALTSSDSSGRERGVHCASGDSRYCELSFFIALRGKQEAKSAVMSEVDTTDSDTTSVEKAAVPPPPANLPPPKPLIMDDNLATSWKQWRNIWLRYEIATGINKQDGLVRVATLFVSHRRSCS